jgi:hypothetical protein
MGYSVVNVDELEGKGPVGAVRFVRRRLGMDAFGVNRIELPPNATGVPAAGPERMTLIAIGARPGSYEPRGPF